MSGRKINNSMFKFMYLKLISEIKNLKLNSFKTRVLILGLTYKKNVADVRNSFPLEIYKLLKKKFKYIDICDPLLKEKKIIGVKILNDFDLNNYELIINLEITKF